MLWSQLCKPSTFTWTGFHLTAVLLQGSWLCDISCLLRGAGTMLTVTKSGWNTVDRPNLLDARKKGQAQRTRRTEGHSAPNITKALKVSPSAQTMVKQYDKTGSMSTVPAKKDRASPLLLRMSSSESEITSSQHHRLEVTSIPYREGSDLYGPKAT